MRDQLFFWDDVYLMHRLCAYVPYSTLAVSLMAGALFMGCATTAVANAEKLSLMAHNSSCSAPLILQHNLKGDNKDAIPSSLIPQTERLARVLAMGYDVAPNKEATGQSVSSNKSCGQNDIYTYHVTPKVKQSAEASYETLYVRHMTRAAIKADPNVVCKPSYTQVYQPPLKLGGAGRVIQVPSGQTCKAIPTKGAQDNLRSNEGEAVGIAGVEKKVSFRMVGSDGKVLTK